MGHQPVVWGRRAAELPSLTFPSIGGTAAPAADVPPGDVYPSRSVPPLGGMAQPGMAQQGSPRAVDVGPRGVGMPYAGVSMTSPPGPLPYRGLPQEQVEDMKSCIQNGNLRISIFNKNFEQEAKILALDQERGHICILNDDGLFEDSWEIDGLKTITQGIAASVLASPPPRDRSAAFRFKFDEMGQEDLFLCVVFDTPEQAWLSLEAFRQLCNTPIEQAP